MPWGNGTFNRTNGTYNGSDVWQDDAANSVDIEADRHDLHDQDLASGISATLNRYGENAIAAHISWGGYRLTDLGNPTQPNDAARKSYVDTAVTAAGNAAIAKDGSNSPTDTIDWGAQRLANLANAAAGGDAVSQNHGDGRYLQLDGSNAMTGNLNAGGYKMSNVANAAAAGDALNKGQADGLYVGVNGTAANADKVDGYHIEVVASLPGSPDPNTLYFVLE